MNKNTNAFDDVLGKAEDGPKAKGKKEPKAAKAAKQAKANYTASVDLEILERVRDAAFFVPGLTVSEVFSEGARLYLAKLEKERGEPIPQRSGQQVKTGRPSSG